MTLVQYDEQGDGFVPARTTAIVAFGAVVAGAVLGGVLVARAPDRSVATGTAGSVAGSGILAGSTSSRFAPTTPGAAAACQRVDALIDRALVDASVLQRAVREQTAVVDQLLAGRVDAAEAADRSTPVLAAGSLRADALDQDVAAYRKAVAACRAGR